MENPTTTEPTGGLPLVKGEMLGKSGLNVLGNKGVALGMDDSASIRDYLQQMINQRQAYKGSFEQGMDQMRSVLGSTQNEMAQNMQAQSAKERTNEQDVFNMRVNMAQLKTQEDRLLQEKQLKQQQMLMTENAIRAASGLPPLTSLPGMGGQGAPNAVQGAQGAPGAVQGAPGAVQSAPSTGSYLTPAQQASIRVLAQTNPDEAIKQTLTLTKPTDLQRELSFLPPTVANQVILAAKAGDMFKPFTYYDPTAGESRTISVADIVGKIVGSPAVGSVTAPPAAPKPVAGPVAAPTPAVGAVVPPAPVAPVAPAPVAPAPVAPAPVAGATPVSAANPFSSQSPNSELIKKAQAEAAIKVEQERQIATNAEAIKVASKASEDLQASADSADNNIIVANRISQNVQKVPELVNLLGKGELTSAILNLAELGVKTPFGSIGINDINQVAMQLDPSIRNIKDPKVKEARLSAAQQLARDFAYLSLQGSKMIQGQGAVSDNERALIKQATGDPSRLTAQNIVLVSRAVKYEAMNAKERRDLWNKMESNGMTFQQFRKSPEMMALKKGQYERMSKVLGLSNAPAFDPALERS